MTRSFEATIVLRRDSAQTDFTTRSAGLDKDVAKRASEKDITWQFIDPGKPMHNAFAESFDGKFREECLNQTWFSNLDQA